jgi:multidrug transporter EmrE-like cation transporter
VFLQHHFQSPSLYLVWLSLAAVPFSLAQMFLNGERADWLQDEACIELLLVHTLLFVFCYYSVALYLTKFDAVEFNLNLLSTGWYGIVLGNQLFHEDVPTLKYVGFACIVFGVAGYSAIENPTQTEL